MKRKKALLVSLACGLACSSPAYSAAAIPAESLVAQPAELTGFTNATAKLSSATSPSHYAAAVLGERKAEVRAEVVRLKRKGFREGVQELLSGPQGEALSAALVLGSTRLARQELSESRHEALKAQGGARIERFAVPGIPGAFGFSAVESGHPLAVANVMFTTGRCFLLVGDALNSSTREQAQSAPLAGATAVYQRARSLCSGR